MESTAVFNSIYISVVGAGSAGAVVSSRLSENGSYSVLLVEAGGYPSPLVNIPLISGTLPSTPFSWNYQTEPQKFGHAASVGHVTKCFCSLHLRRTKINYMIFFLLILSPIPAIKLAKRKRHWRIKYS